MILKLFSLISIILVVLISVSHGVIQRVYDPPSIHPEHPGKCWSAVNNRAFNVDETFTDRQQCQLVKCDRNSRFLKTSCNLRPLQVGCFRTEPDSSKDYPNCCPKTKCQPVKIDY